MLAWMLVAAASATTLDLDVTVEIAGSSASCRVSDVDVTDGATIHLSQRFGKRDFDIELAISEPGDQQVSVEATIARADTHEVVGAPWIVTVLGELASIETSHPRRIAGVDPIWVRVLATEAQ